MCKFFGRFIICDICGDDKVDIMLFERFLKNIE